ncbi:unnamed protein product, partial [marine sediment metagenome]
AAGHKARRYNRLRSPEKLATPGERRESLAVESYRDGGEPGTFARV